MGRVCSGSRNPPEAVTAGLPTAVERVTAGPRTRRFRDPTSDRQPPPALPPDQVSAFSVRQLYHTYMASYVQYDGASWARKVTGMIDPCADRAVFHHLVDLFRNKIEAGELGPGDPLPSKLRLAQEYGISRTTVRQAIGQL